MRSTGLMVACRPPPILAAHIAADDPAQFAEPLQERCIAGLSFGIVRHPGHKHADAPHPLGLLRARRERPGCRAAQTADEVSTSDWTAQHVFSTLPVGTIITVSPGTVPVLG